MVIDGLGRDASDIFKAYCWAMGSQFRSDLFLKKLYFAHPRAERITVPMVERFLSDFEDMRLGVSA